MFVLGSPGFQWVVGWESYSSWTAWRTQRGSSSDVHTTPCRPRMGIQGIEKWWSLQYGILHHIEFCENFKISEFFMQNKFFANALRWSFHGLKIAHFLHHFCYIKIIRWYRHIIADSQANWDVSMCHITFSLYKSIGCCCALRMAFSQMRFCRKRSSAALSTKPSSSRVNVVTDWETQHRLNTLDIIYYYIIVNILL